MKNLLFILFFLPAPLLFAQEVLPNKLAAKEDIAQLFDGALVVRFNTKEGTIKAYREAGKAKIADKIEREKKEENERIMRAFLLHFNFCKVYFIFSSETNKLKTGKEDIFLNGNFETDASIHLKSDTFYFLDYGQLMANQKVDDYSYKGVHYTEESSIPAGGSSCLIIKNKEGMQLQEPFPFATTVSKYFKKQVKAMDGIKHTTDSRNGEIYDSYERAVMKLNKRLIGFYEAGGVKKSIFASTQPSEWWTKNNPNLQAQKLQVPLVEKLILDFHKGELEYIKRY